MRASFMFFIALISLNMNISTVANAEAVKQCYRFQNTTLAGLLNTPFSKPANGFCAEVWTDGSSVIGGLWGEITFKASTADMVGSFRAQVKRARCPGFCYEFSALPLTKKLSFVIQDEGDSNATATLTQPTSSISLLISRAH